MSGLIAVQLTKPYRIWNAGEIAGFPEEEAAVLIESGGALPHETPDEAAKPKRGAAKAEAQAT